MSNSVISLTVQSKPLDLGISERYRNEDSNSPAQNFAHDDQFALTAEKDRKSMQINTKYNEIENIDHRQSVYIRKSVLTTNSGLAHALPLDRLSNNSVNIGESTNLKRCSLGNNSLQQEVEVISNSDDDVTEVINNDAVKSPKSVNTAESNALSRVEPDEIFKLNINDEKLTSTSCKFLANANWSELMFG